MRSGTTRIRTLARHVRRSRHRHVHLGHLPVVRLLQISSTLPAPCTVTPPSIPTRSTSPAGQSPVSSWRQPTRIPEIPSTMILSASAGPRPRQLRLLKVRPIVKIKPNPLSPPQPSTPDAHVEQTPARNTLSGSKSPVPRPADNPPYSDCPTPTGTQR